MLTFGSLFAGIGGFDLGFERAGMRCLWQVEFDPTSNLPWSEQYNVRVLYKHWPNVPKYGDVHNVGKHNLEAVDVITGGFPCQPHSVAGKRRGAEDDRDLWPQYRRIIAELRPRWVVAENVPGIRTTILDAVLSDLDGLDYAARTLIIPACAFDAPHRRERVFVVAYAEQSRRNGGCDTTERDCKEGCVSQVRQQGEQSGFGFGENGTAVPDPTPVRRNGRPHDQGQGQAERDRAEAGGDVADTSGERLPYWRNKSEGGSQPSIDRSCRSWWSVEPDVCRVAYGVPARVDRLRALGNAVVPQVAEFIGRLIVEADK